MARTVTVEIDKHCDGRWQTYNACTVPSGGSGAKKRAVQVARELAQATIGTMLVRVRVIDPEFDWELWHSDWTRPRWHGLARTD